MRLERLCLAFESTDVRLEDDERRFTTSLEDFVNKTEGIVRRIIKFAKRLDAFTVLTQEDQVALLKGSILEILILRSTLYYDPGSNALHQGDFYFKMDSLKKLLEADDVLWGRHVAFVKSFHEQLGADRKTLLMVIAIVLFSPDLPGLGQREKVAHQQETFILLLKHYLESVTSFGDAVYSLPELLGKIGQLRHLCREHSRLLSPVMKSGNRLDPLMAEMFDVAASGGVAGEADGGGRSGGGGDGGGRGFGEVGSRMGSDDGDGESKMMGR